MFMFMNQLQIKSIAFHFVAFDYDEAIEPEHSSILTLIQI